MLIRKTRSNSTNWLIGSENVQNLDDSAKLPTNSLVLRRYLHLRQLETDSSTSNTGSTSVRDLFREILSEILVVWMKANIPTKSENSILDQLESLYKKWLSLKKIANSERRSDAAQKKIQLFHDQLEKLFDISASDAYERLKSSRSPSWQEDWNFLLNQRKVPQVGWMKGCDRSFIERENRAADRRRRRPKSIKESGPVSIIEEAKNNDDSDMDEDDSGEFIPEAKRLRKSSRITVDLPRRSLSKELGQVADRCSISNRKQLQLQSKLIVVGGGNLQDFSLSTATVYRQRRMNRIEVFDRILETWKKDKPKYVVVHWDSKLIQHFTGESSERIAVLVSGGHELKKPKLLGIPSALNATGLTQKSVVFSLLQEWDVVEDVIALVFDTTASNTGIHNGCSKLIECELKRGILWLACRHHIYELHIRHVWTAVAGSANSPVEPLLKRFQHDWSMLDHEPTDLQFFDWASASTFLNDQAKSTLQWAEMCLEKCSFPREDYLELLQLIILYLSGSFPREFRFRKPGAHHRARFMHAELYFLKMQMLSERCQYTDMERDRIKRMADFIAVFHGKAFLQSRLPASAPINDLKYLSAMYLYRY